MKSLGKRLSDAVSPRNNNNNARNKNKKTKPSDTTLFSTPNKDFMTTDDEMSATEASINQSMSRSPARPIIFDKQPPTYYTEQIISEDNELDSDNDTYSRLKTKPNNRIRALVNNNVIFVCPPLLNQVSMAPRNVTDIQNVIDRLQMYMDALQNNIAPAAMSLKKHFTHYESQINRLAYRDIMFAIVNNNRVHRHNFEDVSNMFYKYFIKMFGYIEPMTHAIVNVNYTIGQTNISEALTAYINLCAHYVVSNISLLFNKNTTTINVPVEYLHKIDQCQYNLTSLYNSSLIGLRGAVFYKHTTDNDVNTLATELPDNPRDRIVNVRIQVVPNELKLNF
jgi:hypothetical protein